jgi:zinc protease
MRKVLLTFILASVASLSWASEVNIQTWHNSKGAKVMYVYAPQIPMVDVQVTFDAGSARDGKKWGLAAMTAGLLASGTHAHNEEEISDAFNRLGAQYGADSGRDMAAFSLRTLTRKENYQEATSLFQEVLSEPTFPKSVFEREKANLLEGLKQKKVQPQTLAQEALWKTLYGKHPYAHPVEGTTETIQTLSEYELKQFYQRYYVAKNATIAIVGAVTLSQAKKLAEKLTRFMPSGHRAPALPKVLPVTKAQEKTISFPSSQTYYSLAQIGVKRGDPDYYALFLGNHLLGGSGFASLLMQHVREERGLVYSVYSYFVPMRQPGPFVIGLSTKNSTALEADKVVQQTLKDFMAGKFSEEKLQAIKDNLIGGFPLRLDSNRKILGYIAMIGFYNLPTDYLKTFPEKIAELSKEEVLDAWNRRIHPNKMVKIMVGQPGKAQIK